MKDELKAIALRGGFAATGIVRIKMLPEFPSDDFTGRWDDLSPEVRAKWITLARMLDRWFSL